MAQLPQPEMYPISEVSDTFLTDDDKKVMFGMLSMSIRNLDRIPAYHLDRVNYVIPRTLTTAVEDALACAVNMALQKYAQSIRAEVAAQERQKLLDKLSK